MATELITLASQRANPADSVSPLRGFKSRQAPTIRHDNFGFGDFVAMINPLNYLPGISTLYQEATGMKASPVSSLIGGALLGGPAGMALAGVNAVFETATGKGVLGSIADAVTGPEEAASAAERHAARYRQIANAHKQDYRLFLSA